MLPVFTTVQVKDGIDTGDLMLDLSEYVKKKDAISRTELTELADVVANKLDASPQHKHDIADVKQLQNALNGKYDKDEKYSYNVILSDPEKIPYLEHTKLETMEIVKSKDDDGYKFYVDDSNGDLMITLDGVLIGMYARAAGKWSFEMNGDATGPVIENHYTALNAVCNATLRNITKITTVEDIINTYIAKTDAVIKNHYDALLILCQKHGMIDKDTSDGNAITPT